MKFLIVILGITALFGNFVPSTARAATYQEIYAQCIEAGSTNAACTTLANDEMNANRFTTQPVTTNKYDPPPASTPPSNLNNPSNQTTNPKSMCNGPKGECTYVPLEPLPCTGGNCGQTGTDFPAFLSNIFRILITIGGLFAVVMIVVAGIGYMLSESALDIDKAKSRAKAALWGLLLLTGCWLILNTINPNLLNFNLNSLGQLRTGIPGTPASANPVPAPPPPPTAQQKSNCEKDGIGSIKFNPDNSWTCQYATYY